MRRHAFVWTRKPSTSFFLGTDVGRPVPGDPKAPPVGPTPGGPLQIAGVHEAMGVNGELIGVSITRYEVGVLAHHWASELRSVHDTYDIGCSGSREWRLDFYSRYRFGELAAHVTDEARREIREACREHEAASREYLALSQEGRDRQDAVEHLRHAIEWIEVVGRCQPGLKDAIEGIQVILRGLRRRIEDPA